MTDQENPNDFDSDDDEEEEVPDSGDTIPPTNGWLEQFEALTSDSIGKIEEIVKLGITPDERMVLFKVGISLISLGAEGATNEDLTDEHKAELEVLLTKLIPWTP